MWDSIVKYYQDFMTKVYIFIGGIFGAGSGIVFSDITDLVIKGAIGALVGTAVSFFTTMGLKKITQPKDLDNEK